MIGIAKENMIIILGDAGSNYCDHAWDSLIKQQLENLLMFT